MAVPGEREQPHHPTQPERQCDVNPILVNSCRAWLGAAAEGYPDAGTGFEAQIVAHEARIGSQIDVPHTYAQPGKLPLYRPGEAELAQRKGTYLFQNWKPYPADGNWADAAGGDADVNAHIDAGADAIKALAPKRIFLTLHHEPENDVTEGSAGDCETKPGASDGSPEDYIAMWHNVRERFDAKGVDNVVWVMDYMNYPTWDCLVSELYPGDEYVDWVMFNAYGSGDDSFVANVERFHGVLEAVAEDGHQVLDKPWGIVEWSMRFSTQEQAYAYYDEAKAAVADNTFPRLKAYLIFDSPGWEDHSGLRIGYDDDGNEDPTEIQHYKGFADEVLRATLR